LKLLLACLFWTSVVTLSGTWGRIPGFETFLRVGRGVLDFAPSAWEAPRNPIREPPEESPPPIDDPDSDSEDDPPPPPHPVPPVAPAP